MQRLIVQIYEVQTPTEAEHLIGLGVDHIGSVIISADNWRQSSLKETIRTTQASNCESSLIPLYNDPDTVLRTLEYYQPDIVHFCEAIVGHERMWDFCDELIHLQASVRTNFPKIKIMRSIPIAQSGGDDSVPTMDFAKQFEPVSDFFLTDTYLSKTAGDSESSQPVQGFVGITGKTCNWETARKLVDYAQIPVILAGGISPQNVVEGIRQVKPAGVDSCTQTNALDKAGYPIRFKKDLAKVKNFVEQVRQMDAVHPARKEYNAQ